MDAYRSTLVASSLAAIYHVLLYGIFYIVRRHRVRSPGAKYLHKLLVPGRIAFRMLRWSSCGSNGAPNPTSTFLQDSTLTGPMTALGYFARTKR